jgi:hypothetical protein
MRPLITLAAAAIALSPLQLAGPANPAHAQMAEWTSASLLALEHVDFVVVRVSDKAYQSSGKLTGTLLTNLVGAQGGPAIHFVYVCAASAEIADLKNGVIPKKTGDCTFQDRDGNAIYTASECSLRSRDDWCAGRITGGSGKFTGIAGTIRHRNPAPGKFKRTCVANAAADCDAIFATAAAVPVGTRYHLEGDWAVPYEWEWRFQ